jgi:hypothetical protein
MVMEEIPMIFYAQWYNEDVKKHLSRKQKEALLMKISNISLEKDITSAHGSEFKKSEFPELAPFMHTEKLSGLQLYAVMTELFHELHAKQAKVLGKPYPEPFKTRKKLKEVM